MKKRIDITKFDLKHRTTFDLEDEIKDNLYYNQTWFWCNTCNRKHRIGLSPLGHSIKPIPVKCEVDEDHCWKSTGLKKKIGMDICEGSEDNAIIFLTEGRVVECVVCGKLGLEELTYIMDSVDITDTQLKELKEYTQSIKDIGFKKLYEMGDNRYKKLGIIRIPEFNKRIREIQNLQDPIIIYHQYSS